MNNNSNYITIRRRCRAFLFIFGILEIFLMLFVIVGIASTSEMDEETIPLIVLMILLMGLGVWLIIFSLGTSARLDTMYQQIIVYRHFGASYIVPVNQVCFYEQTQKYLYLYDQSQTEIAKISVTGMKYVDTFLQYLGSGRGLNKLDRHLFEMRLRRIADGYHMVAVILSIVFFACGFLFLVYPSDVILKVIGIVMSAVSLCIIIMAIYRYRCNCWYRTDTGLVNRNGSKQMNYMDQDIVKITDCSADNNQSMPALCVTWNNGKCERFVLDANLANWMDRIGWSPAKVHETTMEELRQQDEQLQREPGNMNNESVVKVIKILTWVIGIASLLLSLFAGRLTDSMRFFCTIEFILPFCNLILPCLFQRQYIVEWKRNKTEHYKKTHLQFPIMFMILQLLASLFMLPKIEIRTMQSSLILAGILFGIQLVILLVCLLPRKVQMGVLISALIMTLVNLYAQTNYLIIRCSDQTVEHEQVTVVKKDISEGKYSDTYYLTVSGPETTRFKMETEHSLYLESSVGSKLKLCKNHSIMGIEYWMLHE